MIPAGGGGAIIGGFVIKRWHLTCSQIMKFCVGTLTISALSTIVMIAYCPDRNIAGVNVPYFAK